tara:strand:+ start:394 stop:906 length:513 start_codon:yes stop_codon:yes gene_type:complete
MRLLTIIFFLIIFQSTSYGQEKIAYIDLSLILKESDVGKFINNHITKIEKKRFDKLKIQETLLKKQEKKIITQKNILKKEEFDQKLNNLKDDIQKYRSEKNKLIDELNKKKIDYTKKVLKELNPIITKYVEDNSISIVFPKKNIVVGKTDLDITQKIIILLNNQLTEIEF